MSKKKKEHTHCHWYSSKEWLARIPQSELHKEKGMQKTVGLAG
jgi:hypothetical protein